MSGLPTFPRQPEGTAWPTSEWTVTEPAADVDRTALDALFDEAFSAGAKEHTGETRALLALHRGAIVAERYADGFDQASTLPSWSMAKSVLQAIVGLLMQQGRLALHERAPVPQWQAQSDPRRAITSITCCA